MLTQKQENFCLEYIKCGNASEAYRRSYNAKKMKDEVIWVKACELLKNGNVEVRVNELKERAVSKAIITVEQRKELLSRWAWEEETPNALKALDLLNKMENLYTQKVQAEHTGNVGVTFHIDLGEDK